MSETTAKGEEYAAAPKGYRTNAQGHLVPVSAIAPIDLIRDDLVGELIGEAKARAEGNAQFKGRAHAKLASFVELAAQDHGVAMGGKKGNLCLTSFDGLYRVMRAIDESIGFTEGLVVARELVERCILRWSDGSNTHLVTLVRKAFETDKAGNLSTARILGLAAVEIDDEEWRAATEAIKKSVRVQCTKSYLRFYERAGDGSYVQIPLDGGAL